MKRPVGLVNGFIVCPTAASKRSTMLGRFNMPNLRLNNRGLLLIAYFAKTKTKMNTEIRFSPVAALLFPLLLSACHFLEEGKPGKLIKAQTEIKDSISVQMQLYPVPGHAPQREIAVWCKNVSALEASSRSVAHGQNLQVDSFGWLSLTAAKIGPTIGSKEAPLEQLPMERIRFVTPEFMYVDIVPGSVAMTFDACRSKRVLGQSEFSRLFTKDELQPSPLKYQSPAFMDRELSKDGSGVCFRVSPIYVNRRFFGFDVCTADKGETWYTMATDYGGKLVPPSNADAGRVYSSSVPYPTLTPASRQGKQATWWNDMQLSAEPQLLSNGTLYAVRLTLTNSSLTDTAILRFMEPAYASFFMLLRDAPTRKEISTERTIWPIDAGPAADDVSIELRPGMSAAYCFKIADYRDPKKSIDPNTHYEVSLDVSPLLAWRRASGRITAFDAEYEKDPIAKRIDKPKLSLGNFRLAADTTRTCEHATNAPEAIRYIPRLY
jgi:hypothetical protein